MKTVILAGGLGTRLAEETEMRPKPMVEIGGYPMLWHLMNLYSASGFDEFVVALGFKGEAIKRYFLDYRRLVGDLTVRCDTGEVVHGGVPAVSWTVHLVDTGLATQTGGRLRRLRPWLQDGTFMMTYGDGLSDIDIARLVQFHRSHGRLATVTAVRPPARFGGLDIQPDGFVRRMEEKPLAGEGWINGGFFVLEPAVLDYISADSMPWERDPMERLAAEGQLVAFRHEGFWQPMDTIREKRILEALWDSGHAPWKV